MRSFGTYICLAIGLLLCGCSQRTENPKGRSIAVSVAPQAALLEALAGDDYDIVTVLDKGADPETFEPGMSRRIAVDKSEAYFTLGGLLPFEAGLTQSVNKDVRVVDTSIGIERAYDTHGGCAATEGHAHTGSPDPHVWSSLVNLAVMVDNMSTALGELNPEREEIYSHRADSLLARLDSIDEHYRAALNEKAVKSFAVWHPSLSYFARDYGLKQIALGQEHKELSAMRLKALIDSASAAGVKVFFFQKEFDSRQAETANERIGSRLVEIYPLSEDWEAQMDLIVDELTRH